jgi:molybdopterin synthase sulfur carrier subunit
MKLVYFSWIRERIGLTEETVALPTGVESVGDLIDWLRGRDETYALALEHDSMVRVALDHVHADDRDAPLANVREVALFPPMTGG